MNTTTFPTVAIGDLPPHSWVRLADGDVGVIHDKVDQPGYRKVCVEIPGHRQPMRFLAFECAVEHVTDRRCALVAQGHHQFA